MACLTGVDASESQACVSAIENLILLDRDCGDKIEGCTIAGEVVECVVLRIVEALVSAGFAMRLFGQLWWSGEDNNSSRWI